MTDEIASIGHNKPPQNLREELEARYKNELGRLTQLEASCEAVPDTITDDKTAGEVGDLMKLIRVAIKAADGARSEEKEPFLKAGQEVDAIFKVPMERLKKKSVAPSERLTAYLEAKAQRERLEREAEAERRREEANRLQREADEALARKREAEEAEQRAREREAEALREAEEAERQRAAAEERRRQAAEAERAALEQKRERERAEKDQNTLTLREARTLMKEAEKLHDIASDTLVELGEGPTARLDELIRPGGLIGNLGATLANSALLDDDQKASVASMRERLGELRKAFLDRVDAKERRRREKARKAEEEAEKFRAAERERQRAADEAATAKARKDREDAEAEAAKAKANLKEKKQDARDARDDAGDAAADQRNARREERRLSEDAERVSGRADRLERRAGAGIAELSRTRSEELGSVSSLARRWGYEIIDRTQIPAASLWPYFSDEDIRGAVSRAVSAGVRELPGVDIYLETDRRTV